MNKTGKKENGADLIVYGRIFTSDQNQIAEAFAVKDGRAPDPGAGAHSAHH